MSSESVRKFYDAARDEVLMRMRLRDNVILVFLGGVSTLFAVAIKSDASEVLFCVPYLSLGAAMIVGQHYMVMGRIAYYCVKEVGPFLAQKNEDAPQWDTSHVFHDMVGWSVWLRCLSLMVLLGLPSATALAMTKEHAFGSTFPFGPLWWISALCLLFTLMAILVVHNDRRKLYGLPDWPWKKT